MALADSEVPSWDIYLEAEESIQVKAYARIDPTLGEYADHFKVAGGASDLSTDVQRIPWLVGVVADDRGHDVLGTAFHVRGGWFLTAAHVVQGRVRAGLETRCITAPEPGDITPKNNLVIDPNSVRFHKKLDVCRFRLLDPRQFPEPALALDAPDCNCAPKPGPVPCHRADIVGYGGGSAFPIRTLNALLIGNDSQTIRGLGNTWRCYSGAPLLGPGDSIIGLMFKQSSEDTVDGEPIVLRVDSVNAFTAISLEAIVDFLPGSPQ
jgi:hypothetical protein